jgi:hypothetical protein
LFGLSLPDVSTSPTHERRSRTAARAAIFLATVFASITASTAVVGLDPTEDAQTAESTNSVAAPLAIRSAEAPELQPSPIAEAAPVDVCGGPLGEPCAEPLPSKTAPPDAVAACSTGGEHNPLGTLVPVIGENAGSDEPGVVRVRFEIEEGLSIDGDCFATEVMQVLNDDRGWSGIENVTFSTAGDGPADLRVVLASPETTDSLCYPARTNGRYSCRKGTSVVVNVTRWETGTDDYADDLSTYRTYLINHEVGHFFGRGHLGCPAPGELAPVMMQQTKGLDECRRNGWPTTDEQ